MIDHYAITDRETKLFKKILIAKYNHILLEANKVSGKKMALSASKPGLRKLHFDPLQTENHPCFCQNQVHLC